MDVVFDRLARRLSWRREQWSDVDIETEIREGGGNYFLSAVMAILSNLGD